MKNKMPLGGRRKILHILGDSAFGGIEKLVLDVSSKQYRDPSLETAVFFMRSGKSGFRTSYDRVGMELFAAGLTSGYDVNPSRYLYAYRAFRRFDILHIHAFNPFVALIAILSGRKIVYTINGGFGFGQRHQLSDRVNAWFLKLFLNKYVHVVTVNSRFTERAAKGRYGLAGANVKLVYNGISFDYDMDCGEDIPEELAAELGQKFIVGTTSRFAAVKRIDRLIEAFSEFQKGKQTVLLLVGDGPLRSALESITKAHRLERKVIFTGFCSNVRAFQRAMDVCVLPSKGESFGLVAVEVLSIGRPTVVFKDAGGMAEIVEGICKEDIVENLNSLVERLNYYYRNRHKLNETQEERAKYAKKYDIRKMVDKFRDIYCEIT